MSTFDGLISEFPDIRVDFFRHHAGHRPPLACFLSHIHSDHLAGLESFKSPFIYCSAATRQMLPALERYPCRINFANGILEARQQTYKHLRNLLKPLPMGTPTTLELEPGNHIAVTLLEANHCPGAVMFLFEGHGKAVLYTGDIRSEPWFVNSITRSPALIEYSSGIKTLDKIYLDTSFVDKVEFQTKAQGIQELLRKVALYPKETVFHFQAWTYGYEDVWIALSKALGSKIHVDDYKMRVYRTLVAKHASDAYGAQLHYSPEAASLVGFMCGNAPHSGCLTSDEHVRLHSCEKGNYCSTITRSAAGVVWIQPIVAHLADGRDIVEIGVGGGGDDLEREAELDFVSLDDIEAFFDIVRQDAAIPDELKDGIHAFLLNFVANRRNVSLNLDISTFGDKQQTNISRAIEAVVKRTELGQERARNVVDRAGDAARLPSKITFPYSRHSSLPELCLLVDALRPKDVWPCTVSPREWVENGISIRQLFGQYCYGSVFEHDVKMAGMAERFLPPRKRQLESQVSEDTASSPIAMSLRLPHRLGEASVEDPSIAVADETGPGDRAATSNTDESFVSATYTPTILGPVQDEVEEHSEHDNSSQPVSGDILGDDSQLDGLSQGALEVRMTAFQAMMENAGGLEWHPIGLISTTDHHSNVEEELGS